MATAMELLKINIWEMVTILWLLLFFFLLLREDAANGLVQARWNMKDLVSCVHVVAKAFNFEVSRCHLADYVKELY